MDDPLKSLANSLAEITRQERHSSSAAAAVIREYTEWVNDVAVPALEKVKATITGGDDNVEVDVDPSTGFEPPRPSIQVYRSEQPTFVYTLFLHPQTGIDRAMVMKRHTVFDPDVGRTSSRWATKFEETPLVAERADDWRNDAKAITEDDIIGDVGRHYLAHRRRQWRLPDPY